MVHWKYVLFNFHYDLPDGFHQGPPPHPPPPLDHELTTAGHTGLSPVRVTKTTWFTTARWRSQFCLGSLIHKIVLSILCWFGKLHLFFFSYTLITGSVFTSVYWTLLNTWLTHGWCIVTMSQDNSAISRVFGTCDLVGTVGHGPLVEKHCFIAGYVSPVNQEVLYVCVQKE